MTTEVVDYAYLQNMDCEWSSLMEELNYLNGDENALKETYFDVYERCRRLALRDLYIASEQIFRWIMYVPEYSISKLRYFELFSDRKKEKTASKYVREKLPEYIKNTLLLFLLYELFYETQHSSLAFAINLVIRNNKGMPLDEMLEAYNLFFEKFGYTYLYDSNLQEWYTEKGMGFGECMKVEGTERIHTWIGYAISHETRVDKLLEYNEWNDFYKEYCKWRNSGCPYFNNRYSEEVRALFSGRKLRIRYANEGELFREKLENGKLDLKYMFAIKTYLRWECRRLDRNYKRIHDFVKKIYHLDPNDDDFYWAYYFTKHYRLISVMQSIRPLSELLAFNVVSIPAVIFFAIRGFGFPMLFSVYMLGLGVPYVLGAAGLWDTERYNSGSSTDFGSFMSGYFIGKYF